MELSPGRLFGGTALLAGLYVAAGPRGTDGPLLLWAALEAALFAAVVLWAYRGRRPLASLGFMLSSVVANVLLMAAWPWVLILPAMAAQSLGLGDGGSRVAGFAFYSAAGALLFCLLIDGFLRPRNFSLRTYGLTALLCAGAGLPFVLDGGRVLGAHKAVWWLLFAAGLWLAGRSASRASRSAGEAVVRAVTILLVVMLPLLHGCAGLPYYDIRNQSDVSLEYRTLDERWAPAGTGSMLPAGVTTRVRFAPRFLLVSTDGTVAREYALEHTPALAEAFISNWDASDSLHVALDPQFRLLLWDLRSDAPAAPQPAALGFPVSPRTP